jgi:tetratricopeptide (TPR) repeat protein
MSTFSTSMYTLLAIAALMAGCRSASPAAKANGTQNVEAKRTATDWAVAVRSLDARVADAERRFDKAPTLLHRKQLVGQLLESSTRLGRVSALDRIVSLAEEGVALTPKYAAPYLLRAKAYGAVHRFDDALADLDHAIDRGASQSGTRGQRATLLMGLGRLDEACPILSAQRHKHANHVNLMLEAMCLGKMGQLSLADRRFAEAYAAYRDVSPFILGWMHFERGALWGRAGREDKAEEYYRAAVTRMPLYAHAAGHLAYLVPPAQARPMLAKVIATSDDPEYVGALALVSNEEALGSGAESLSAAKRGYDALMRQQPLAFADHAAWFYLVVAKLPERAIEVAELNLRNRQTAEAYELMIAAQISVGDDIEACETADRGLAIHSIHSGSRGLASYAAKALRRCGRADRATEVLDDVNAHDLRVAKL